MWYGRFKRTRVKSRVGVSESKSEGGTSIETGGEVDSCPEDDDDLEGADLSFVSSKGLELAEDLLRSSLSSSPSSNAAALSRAAAYDWAGQVGDFESHSRHARHKRCALGFK
jgi:hypothetical protein